MVKRSAYVLAVLSAAWQAVARGGGAHECGQRTTNRPILRFGLKLVNILFAM